DHTHDTFDIRRRAFLKVGAGLTAAGGLMTSRERALAQDQAEKARLQPIPGSPVAHPPPVHKPRGRRRPHHPRPLSRGAVAPPSPNAPATPANRDRTTTAEMKQKYGEITMLDYPQWTKDHFPGVTRLDIFSGLFGDVTDDSMYITAAEGGGGGAGFNPT